MAECGGLENRYGGDAIGGSNPSPSAIFFNCDRYASTKNTHKRIYQGFMKTERWQSGRMRRLAKPLSWYCRLRGFESPPLRQLLVLSISSLFLFSACVTRTLRVETQPTGALVFLDGKKIGESPIEVPFYHFGLREIVAEKDGYLRTVELIEIEGAWYEAFPFDYFTEFLPLFPRTDLRIANLNLRPSPRNFVKAGENVDDLAAREALLKRAQSAKNWSPAENERKTNP